MISPITIILYIVLAIIVFVVQMFLFKKSESKAIQLIPFFAMITALLVAYIMVALVGKSGSVKCGTLMPAVRVIKDAVTSCMVADAAAIVKNKMKKKD